MGLMARVVLVVVFGSVALAQTTSLVYMSPGLLASEDPHNHFSMQDIMHYGAIYDPLVRIDANGQFIPALAESWAASADGLEWTFNLRQGVTFHHGKPFTAEDVKFTFERVRSPDLRQSFMWRPLEEVVVVDDFTVILRTSEPVAPLLNFVFMTSILPADAFTAFGDEFFDLQYGTGPFKFVSYERGVRAVLARNENFWDRGYPVVDEAIWLRTGEDASAMAALVAGEVDVLVNISLDLALELEGRAGVEIYLLPSLEAHYLNVNVTREPLGDPRVVLALNHAIDREEIAEGLLMGQATPAVAYVPPALLGYHPNLELFAYDPERAKELLAEAGYPDGVTLSLTFSMAWPDAPAVAQAIREQARPAGFDIELNLFEHATYLDMRRAGNYDLAFIGSVAVTDEGVRWFQERVLGDGDSSGYVNEELNALIERLATTLDPVTQEEVFWEIQELMYGGPPMVFLYHPMHRNASRVGIDMAAAQRGRGLFQWLVDKP